MEQKQSIGTSFAIHIELADNLGGTELLTRKVLNLLKESEFDKLLIDCMVAGVELKWTELTKDAWERPQPNAQLAKFDSADQALSFCKVAAKHLPHQFTYAKVVRMSTYVDPKDKQQRTRHAKTYGRSVYLNDYR